MAYLKVQWSDWNTNVIRYSLTRSIPVSLTPSSVFFFIPSLTSGETPVFHIMTTPPDMSSLRLHDSSYDSYEASNSASRPQYHFATSPGIPVPSQYNPLTVGQSPLKAKPARNPLPTVRSPRFFPRSF